MILYIYIYIFYRMFKSVIVFLTALASVFLPFVLITWLLSLSFRTHFGGITVITPKRLISAICIPGAIGFRELYRENLTISGIIAAMIVGFILTLASGTFIITMLVSFLTSAKLTKFRSKKKAEHDEEATLGSQRTWLNVFNNGAVPTAVAILYIIEVGCQEIVVDFHNPYLYISSWLSVSVLGAIACGCGDTWASEVGPAFGDGTSVLISTGSKVPAGTNGGITVIGSLASLGGGFVVGLAFAITNWILTGFFQFQYSLVWIGAFSGFVGSAVDSLLGATLQYSGYNEETKKVVGKPGPNVKHICGLYILNNHAVNFISCCVISLLAPYVYLVVVSLFS